MTTWRKKHRFLKSPSLQLT